MSAETVHIKENSEQRVISFIKDMKAIKFDGPRGKFDLDTFFLVVYNQITGEDEIEFVSWAVDSSRVYPDYLKYLLSHLPLPKKKDHLPYPRTDLQYYDDSMPYERRKVPIVAFGTGAKGRTILYRCKGMSTKNSFERLKNAAEVTIFPQPAKP